MYPWFGDINTLEALDERLLFLLATYKDPAIICRLAVWYFRKNAQILYGEHFRTLETTTPGDIFRVPGSKYAFQRCSSRPGDQMPYRVRPWPYPERETPGYFFVRPPRFVVELVNPAKPGVK